MRRRWSDVPRVGFGVMLITLFACSAAPPGSPASGSASGAAQSSAPAARDKVAEVTGIVWFGNEIENAALEKLITARGLVPPKPPKGSPPLPPLTTTYDWIQKLLEQARAGIAGLKGGDQCPFECPPGVCDPGCAGSPPRRDPPKLGDPVPPDLPIQGVRWSINALENGALEKLMVGVPYTTIRQSLSDVLTKIKTGP